MSSDPDIHFGDLEEDQPEVERRPDRNRHYSVVAYGEPAEGELPMFVDLDALIEMESHALTDTSVELGGVMLGGQLTDEEGKPYVFVRDSIRAEHYEATKGSFKFTHDTWQQITRQRDEFPEDWDMVGWYHTHPDWGVFLSGMDMFICDNFFNKPLDVALVIDPCRQDRGLFQWTGDPRHRVKRVSGFYVVSSRHRQAELQQFVAELEDGMAIRTDPKMRGGYNVSSGGGGAPTIVNITEQQPRWLGQAVVLTLVAQMMMLLLIAYVAISPSRGGSSAQEQELARREEDVRLKNAVIDRVIERMEPGGEEAGPKIRQANERILKLESTLAAATEGVPVLIRDNEKLAENVKDLKKRTENLTVDKERYKQQYFDEKDKADELRAQLAKYTGESGEETTEGPQSFWDWMLTWQGIAVSLALILAAALIATVAVRSGREEAPREDDFSPPPPPEEGEGSGSNEQEGDRR